MTTPHWQVFEGPDGLPRIITNLTITALGPPSENQIGHIKCDYSTLLELYDKIKTQLDARQEQDLKELDA